ncbi:MAG: arylsulfatase, partial [Candidatus Poribacteria bacterium]
PEKTGSDPDSDVYIEDYLYNLESDPYERNNLISESGYEDIRVELSARLKSYMVSIGEKEPIILSAK